MMEEFDYIVVGGGSGGCAAASRLSEDPDVSVCLLEAGGPDKSFLIHMPVGVAAIIPGGPLNWAFETVPQKGLNNRKGYQPRGKTLGGSSSINAMVYIRGHRLDYDRWAQEGATGWSYDDVLPYFKKLENFEGGEDEYHSVGGPLNAKSLQSPNPINELFYEAGRQMQLPINYDFNGSDQEGIGPYHVTQKDGQRHSAARAYLHPHDDRSNLTVLTKTRATRILFYGKRAVGVEIFANGQKRKLYARKEVVLSLGAFQTPQLLMLSGVGPASHLAEHGIDCVLDVPEVGANLQDHIDYVLSYKSRSTNTFGFSIRSLPKMARGLFSYLTKRQGLFTSNLAESGGFLKSDHSVEQPDLQLHFVSGLVDDHGRKLHWGHGISCHVCVLRPKSRGTVRLNSNDPMDAPQIDPNFLADDDDMRVLLSGLKLTRRLMKSPALSSVVGKELFIDGVESDDQLMEGIRNRADTVYHPVGTCRMGSDPDAVVDPQLRVNGLEGLRIADASVMPSLISGNTNAPTMMIGERAADFIKGAI